MSLRTWPSVVAFSIDRELSNYHSEATVGIVIIPMDGDGRHEASEDVQALLMIATELLKIVLASNVT